jgi:hypothetical protein
VKEFYRTKAEDFTLKKDKIFDKIDLTMEFLPIRREFLRINGEKI